MVLSGQLPWLVVWARRIGILPCFCRPLPLSALCTQQSLATSQSAWTVVRARLLFLCLRLPKWLFQFHHLMDALIARRSSKFFLLRIFFWWISLLCNLKLPKVLFLRALLTMVLLLSASLIRFLLWTFERRSCHLQLLVSVRFWGVSLPVFYLNFTHAPSSLTPSLALCREIPWSR